MLALVGQGDLTPLSTLSTRAAHEVLVGGDVVFPPITARLMTQIEQGLADWSASLGLARTRFVSSKLDQHEAVALDAADAAVRLGCSGIYQIAEKQRVESQLTPLFRMPVFIMWEGFSLHGSSNEWMTIARSACEVLAQMIDTEVVLAVSENTLAPNQPAVEYVLMDSDLGEEEYVQTKRGELTNVSTLSVDLSFGVPSQTGIELGNSYKLDPREGRYASAHSIGVDRLAGALLRQRPENLLDWADGPLKIDAVRFGSEVTDDAIGAMVEGSQLTVVGTGDDENLLREAMNSRRSRRLRIASEMPLDRLAGPHG